MTGEQAHTASKERIAPDLMFLSELMPQQSITEKCQVVMFDVASAQFGILQYIQCMHHGLTCVLLCVSFIFADYVL